MSGYPDDRDRPDRDRGDDEREIAAARAATAVPGTFLMLNGLFGLVFVAILSDPMIFQPEMLIQSLRDLAAQQPQGKERQDMEKKIDEAEQNIKQNRGAMQIQNTIQLGILAVGNLLAVIGGLAMRALGSYGLSVTGSLVSVLPIVTGCCCTGIPFGLWALVVLMRPEVKAGYAARRRASFSPDRY
jgi:hypothetical protein